MGISGVGMGRPQSKLQEKDGKGAFLILKAQNSLQESEQYYYETTPF